MMKMTSPKTRRNMGLRLYKGAAISRMTTKRIMHLVSSILSLDPLSFDVLASGVRYECLSVYVLARLY